MKSLEECQTGSAEKRRRLGENPNNSKPNSRESNAKKNTAIYVTGLPEDVTIDELNEYFSKVGVIMEDFFTGGPRIKLYEDEEGRSKGDALIVYLREESVALAINILDESQLRPGKIIYVQPATFSQTLERPEAVPKAGEKGQPAESSRKIDKATWMRKMELMQKKLGWEEGDHNEDDADGSGKEKKNNDKRKRIVVIRNMYDPEELAEDPSFMLELKQELFDKCSSRIGPVTSVHVLDHLGSEGVCTVSFRNIKDANACVQVMNNMHFAGRKLTAEIYDGSFRLSEKKGIKDGAADEQDRIVAFGNWLEGQELTSESDQSE